MTRLLSLLLPALAYFVMRLLRPSQVNGHQCLGQRATIAAVLKDATKNRTSTPKPSLPLEAAAIRATDIHRRASVAFVSFAISAILLLLAGNARAAVGDITGAWLDTNGFTLYVGVSGLNSNGTWSSFGYRTNGLNRNIPSGSEKVRMLVRGWGYDTSGNVVLRDRMVYGTTQQRKIYPDTNVFETFDGTTTVLQIAMSDWVFTGETCTVDIASGLYTESAVPNAAATAVSVTNGSFHSYHHARVIANNVWPQLDRATGSTYRVRVAAYHWSAVYENAGKPVHAVKFWATDERGTALTQTVTQASIDWSARDAAPVIEYLWDIPLSGFQDTNTITVQWIAYPYIGTNSQIDTSDGAFTSPHPNYCSYKFLNDRNGTYGFVWGNVNPSGDDGAGIVTNSANWTTNLTAFRTIGGLAHKAMLYNSNAFGHIDCGGATAFLDAGNYLFSGTNLAVGVQPKTYFTVTRMPHLTANDVFVISNGVSGGDLSDAIRVTGITIGGDSATGSAFIFTGVNVLWLDDNVIATGQPAAIFNITNCYYTRNNALLLEHGMANVNAGTIQMPALVRGNWLNFTGSAATVKSGLVLGNVKTNRNTLSFNMDNQSSGVTHRPRVATIFQGNLIYNITNSTTPSGTLDRDIVSNDYSGIAFVQNLYEAVSDHEGALSFISGTGSSNSPNMLRCNNTLIIKVNGEYNDAGSNPSFRYLNWDVGNIYADYNIKTDTFATANAGRYGNYGPLYGVGAKGNAMPETFDVGAAGSFPKVEAGLMSYQVAGATTTNTLGRFTRWGAYVNAVGVGLGDYRLLNDSPFFRWTDLRLLPFDITGAPRGAIDPPGAYAAGNVKKGSFF